jgi:maleate isomerase
MNACRIGVITPSSNTVLEPVTAQILSALPEVTAHFGRFAVTHISPDTDSQAQFTVENQLTAARLLADARVDVIVWSGTAASWLGFEQDTNLCKAITAETGIPAGSAVLGINEIFERNKVRTFALISPYVESIQNDIEANYAAAGFDCVAERHLNEQDNFSFAMFDEACVQSLMLDCAQSNPDAITVMCTNMRGASLAAKIENQTNALVVDSTAAAVWHALQIAGVDRQQVRGWGRMFGSA